MLKNHRLPIWTTGNEVGKSTAPTEYAFRGKLRRYELGVGVDQLDLMNVIMRNKEEIDALIDKKVHEGLCKLQLHLDVSMIKFGTIQMKLVTGNYATRRQCYDQCRLQWNRERDIFGND